MTESTDRQARGAEPPVDVLVVGSGAGGGPLALSLSRAGLRVLVLEKGPRFERREYAHGEGGLPPDAFLPSPEEDPHTVVTRKTRVARRTRLGWIASCVGGGTSHMGGYLYRFHPDDFRLRSRFGPRQELAEALADWPYGYDELEPYYSLAEWEVGVSGGSLRGAPSRFEGPRSRPYPMPPLAAHPIAAELDLACRRRGLHPIPTPRAVNSREYGSRPGCAYCMSCAGYGCPVGARGSTQESLLPRAEATGRCVVRSRAMVREILVGRDGRAQGCLWIDDSGAEHEARARVVCVCCSAVESARLLLLSRSPRFPDGLANGSGLVGRHLQFHSISMAQARFRLDGLPGSLLRDPHPMLGRSVLDHYFLPDGVSVVPKGGVLRFGRASQVLPPEAGGPRPEGASERTGRGLLYCEVFHDFLANPGTRIELDPEVRDRWGLPVARIHLDRPAHHPRAGWWLLQRAFEVFDELGAEEVAPAEVGGIVSHATHGTCRAGHDPATSVLGPYCQAHEVPNLFVVDGSFMPTSGGASTTLTILANSFRTADHIARRCASGDL